MRISSLLSLVAVLLTAPAISRADAPDLKVTATADYTEVHPESTFDVTLSLENLTNTVEKIKVPDGAWDRLWRSSTRLVTWDALDDGGGNTSSVVEIAPHETYTFPDPLKMYVADSVKAPHIDFRVGFKTTAFGKTVWSAPITLDVIQ